jgi:hypothetical protein
VGVNTLGNGVATSPDGVNWSNPLTNRIFPILPLPPIPTFLLTVSGTTYIKNASSNYSPNNYILNTTGTNNAFLNLGVRATDFAYIGNTPTSFAIYLKFSIITPVNYARIICIRNNNALNYWNISDNGSNVSTYQASIRGGGSGLNINSTIQPTSLSLSTYYNLFISCDVSVSSQQINYHLYDNIGNLIKLTTQTLSNSVGAFLATVDGGGASQYMIANSNFNEVRFTQMSVSYFDIYITAFTTANMTDIMARVNQFYLNP